MSNDLGALIVLGVFGAVVFYLGSILNRHRS